MKKLLFLLMVLFLFLPSRAQAQPVFAYEYYCSKNANFNACYAARGTATRLIVDQPNFPIGSATTVASTVTIERRGKGSIDCASSGTVVLTSTGPIIAEETLLFPNCPATALSFANTVQQIFKSKWFDPSVGSAVVQSGHLDTDLVAAVVPNLSAILGAGNTALNLPLGKSNAITFGWSSSGKWYLYGDSNGPVLECEAANGTRCDASSNIASGRRWFLYDEANNGRALEYIPGAASANAMWQFTQTGSRWFKTSYVEAAKFSVDGTNCTSPVNAALDTSKPKDWYVVCADNDASLVDFSVMTMAEWDGSAIYFTPSTMSTTNQNTTIAAWRWQAACVRDGDQIPNIPSKTSGANVSLTFGNQTDDLQIEETTAVTPTGTCTGGALLHVFGFIDATATTATMANVKTLGVKVRFRVSSPSS